MTILNVTERAICYFRSILSANPLALGILIKVLDTGCSGKSYSVDLALDNSNVQAIEEDIENVKFLIAHDSVKYLQNCKIDYVTEGCNAVIKFDNPNVTATCGCGESFSVKET